MEKYTANPMKPSLLYGSMALPRMDTSYKIDEGYSEETRSQDELDSPMRLDTNAEGMVTTSIRLAMDSIVNLSEEGKSEFVYSVLQTLRTSSIASIVERLRPYLYKDPVAYLPPEITSEIFSYLTPSMLLDAARVSQSWRERTLDSRLWKQKFYSEGWDLETEELGSLDPNPPSPRKTRGRRAETYGEQRRQNKRIRADSALGISMAGTASKESIVRRQEAQLWNEQNGTVEADVEQGLPISASMGDEEMHDVDSELSSSVMTPRNVASSSNMLAGGPMVPSLGNHQPPETNECPEFQGDTVPGARRISDISMGTTPRNQLDSEPPLISYMASGYPRLNYQQLYKQRRRLEDNWLVCAYKSFQLPHRDHPEEAHGECVYTIQYIGRYLVSGSRDRTLRKWDLETQRLIGKPMQGHSASVLCLQFDNSPEEDIIISGSSDTDVIVWRYSTGELVERISRAHQEPVLNLKFDHRFLVTCSKDKTIKLWNRHNLSPGDQDYPVKGVKGGGRCPAHIVDLSTVGANPFDIQKFLTPEQREPLPGYTNLMTLDSHSAAVNAIHIYKDQLVSASGDRFVKVWDIHTGECIATCRGHQKGIACVQYDGKRIISGSSDNTIRIYDPETQAEVACLQGHTRLVRTIQSAFEDLPGGRDQLENEARGIDGQFFLAHDGRLPEDGRSRMRNPGSSQPKDITAVGVKLPPGGGGSRWGRIVSGSYDETIIIWRKGADGRWVPGHRLRQEEALRAAGGPLASISDPQPPPNVHIPWAARRQAGAPRANMAKPVQLTPEQHAQEVSNTIATIQGNLQQLQQPSPQPSQPSRRQPIYSSTERPPPIRRENRGLEAAQMIARTSTASEASSSHVPSSHHTASQSTPQPSRPLETSPEPDMNPGAQATQAFHLYQQQQPLHYHHQQHQHHHYQQQRSAPQQPHPSSSRPSQQPPITCPPATNIQYPLTSQPNIQPQSNLNPPQPAHGMHPVYQPPPNPPQAPTHATHPHLHPPQQHHHHHAAIPPPGPPMQQPNARVFKLQFDARRIICCSQDPKIVGWDFANGDERIVEASRFFKAPQ